LSIINMTDSGQYPDNIQHIKTAEIL
jgi:hypothetical protein